MVPHLSTVGTCQPSWILNDDIKLFVIRVMNDEEEDPTKNSQKMARNRDEWKSTRNKRLSTMTTCVCVWVWNCPFHAIKWYFPSEKLVILLRSSLFLKYSNDKRKRTHHRWTSEFQFQIIYNRKLNKRFDEIPPLIAKLKAELLNASSAFRSAPFLISCHAILARPVIIENLYCIWFFQIFEM